MAGAAHALDDSSGPGLADVSCAPALEGCDIERQRLGDLAVDQPLGDLIYALKSNADALLIAAQLLDATKMAHGGCSLAAQALSAEGNAVAKRTAGDLGDNDFLAFCRAQADAARLHGQWCETECIAGQGQGQGQRCETQRTRGGAEEDEAAEEEGSSKATAAHARADSGLKPAPEEAVGRLWDLQRFPQVCGRWSSW